MRVSRRSLSSALRSLSETMAGLLRTEKREGFAFHEQVLPSARLPGNVTLSDGPLDIAYC